MKQGSLTLTPSPPFSFLAYLLGKGGVKKWGFPLGFEPGAPRTTMHCSPMARHPGVAARAAISFPYETRFYDVIGLSAFGKSILQVPDTGIFQYWWILEHFGVPVLPENVIFTLFRTCWCYSEAYNTGMQKWSSIVQYSCTSIWDLKYTFSVHFLHFPLLDFVGLWTIRVRE